MGKYRKINPQEIDKLLQNNCRCDDWNLVEVVKNFSTKNIINVNFSGRVRLGLFEKEIFLAGNISKKTGIYNATIHNTTVADNVYINQVRGYIANYFIDEEAIIDNVDLIAVESTSTFGNGTEVNVLSETGGREVLIYDCLSAQTAYLMAMYRDDTQLVETLYKMIYDYAEKQRADIGYIGKHVRINSCKTIIDTKICDYAVIDNVFRLKNGTVNSLESDSTYVGLGVIAENFIISSGSKMSDNTLVANCFIGQGCELSKQYSAEHSVFFANSAGYHGEACSIFAGPYTVTHHKSTLLIAGYFSFMNAGSGSNQSNHIYKLGPIHQGVLERGTKTASNSYMLWPAKIGPFSLIMGRHNGNSDTSDLPFSYLIEKDDETILSPAINLRSIGTIRDAVKWKQRDKRNPEHAIDCVNLNMLSPYIVDKMIKGIGILDELLEKSGISSIYVYNNAKIKEHSLHKGLELYELGVVKYIGNVIFKKVLAEGVKTINDFRKMLASNVTTTNGEWVDICGMYAPATEVKLLLTKIKNGLISIEDINKEFKRIHNDYQKYEWQWVCEAFKEINEINVSEMELPELKVFLDEWIEAVVLLDELVYEDAIKEFKEISKISFGIDGGPEEKDLDFINVRGRLEENTFIKTIHEHIKRKQNMYEQIVKQMNL